MSEGSPNLTGAAFGLGAATLFGASAPLAKLLLVRCGPLMLSALLYLGAATALCAMKAIGIRSDASREAAYFATAPFIGALLSMAVFEQLPRVSELIAAASMAAGILLLLREQHCHTHVHTELIHDHLHVHDEHHAHHAAAVAEPHSHVHRHAPLIHQHAHAHAPDAHHRHAHS